MSETILSVSSVAEYKKCPRRYWYKKHSGIVLDTTPSPAQDLGSVVHAGFAGALLTSDASKPLIAAVDAARAYAAAHDVAPNILENATDLLCYHVPRLGLGATLVPARTSAGEPLVEAEFVYLSENTGVTLRGTVDAVVVNRLTGKTVLIDWKVRSREFYPAAAVQLDAQLYVYAAIVGKVWGVQLDAIQQIQLLSRAPAVPEYKKDTDEFKDVLGKTTAAVLEESLSQLSAEEASRWRTRWMDKIVPDEYFIQTVDLDIRLVKPMVAQFLATTLQIRDDQRFIPLLDAYACKFCPWLGHCHAASTTP